MSLRKTIGALLVASPFIGITAISAAGLGAWTTLLIWGLTIAAAFVISVGTYLLSRPAK